MGDAGSIGTLAGNGGTDTLSYLGDSVVVSVNLLTSIATSNLVNNISFTSIESFIGDDSTTGTNSTLIGANGTNAWLITNNNAGSLNSGAYTFSGFGNLTGGTGDDSFTFTDAKKVSGSINGGLGGTNLLDLTAYTTNVNVTLTGHATDGFSGTTAGTPNPVGVALANITDITVGTGTNTLTGENTANIWTITGTNSGSLNDGSVTLNFTNFAKLVGGTNTDQFILSGGNLTGTPISIDGGDGVDTLTGHNVANTWTITGTDTGTLTTVLSHGLSGTFNDIQNLVGNTGADTFIFNDTATITGTINGGGLSGANILDLSLYTTATNVTLTGSAATGYAGSVAVVGGGFSDITRVKAAAGAVVTNVLTLSGAVSTVTITGFVDDHGFSGTVATAPATLMFDNFNTINGAAVNNTLVGRVATNIFTINNTNSGTYDDGLEVLTFTNMPNLTGGATGSNTFNFTLTGNVDGNIVGSASAANTISLTGLTASAQRDVVITTNGTDTGLKGTALSVIDGYFDNINTFNNKAHADNLLTGANLATTWTISSTNFAGTVATASRSMAYTDFPYIAGVTAAIP